MLTETGVKKAVDALLPVPFIPRARRAGPAAPGQVVNGLQRAPGQDPEHGGGRDGRTRRMATHHYPPDSVAGTLL